MESVAGLIRFDLDGLACKAKSLLTEVIIANMDAVAGIEPRSGMIAAGDTLMRVLLAAGTAKVAAAGAASRSDPVSLPNPQGLHARPAAVLAAEAKRFKADVRLVRGSMSPLAAGFWLGLLVLSHQVYAFLLALVSIITPLVFARARPDAARPARHGSTAHGARDLRNSCSTAELCRPEREYRR